MKYECKITVLETKCFPELQERFLADPEDPVQLAGADGFCYTELDIIGSCEVKNEDPTDAKRSA